VKLRIALAVATLAAGGVAWAAGATVVLDFGGATVAPGDDDPTVPSSSTLSQAATIPPFDGAVAAPRVSASAARTAVIDRVRTLFLPYDVEVTTIAPPSSGDWVRVFVGGGAATVGRPFGLSGLATLDCGDARAGGVAFVFAGDLQPRYGGVVAIANTVAHEAAHTLGLQHVVDGGDVMFSGDPGQPAPRLSQLFGLRFGRAAYSPYQVGGVPQPEQCGQGDPLDQDALLRATVGARDPATLFGDAAPPSLGWQLPRAADGDAVATSLPVRVTATDDLELARVEVYKNLELVASLVDPPFATELAATDGEVLYVTVEAIDRVARRTTETRRYRASAGSLRECDDGAPCPVGDCVAGVCVAPADLSPPPGEDGGSCDGGSCPAPPSGGCAIAARAGSPSSAFVVLLVVAVAALRRRRLDGRFTRR
jgi:MYXO-CTERM domain-containing protein